MRRELLAGEAEAIAVALKWTGETGNGFAEGTFRKLRRKIGCVHFAEAVLDADAEARAGEEPRNRGAALVARMQSMIPPPPGAVSGFSARIHAGGITSLKDPEGCARAAAAVGLK